jgi:hypothetical protein
MWTTLALALALQAGPAQQQNPGLSVANARLTYGHLGPTRKDATFFPGDWFTMAFEVRNVVFDKTGNASYSVGMEVLDGEGNVRFRQLPRNQTAQNFLGGSSVFSAAFIDLPYTAKPGDYTVRVTIEDRATNAKATMEQKGKVLPPDFGLIRVGVSADREGLVPCSPVVELGESLYVNFAVTGYGRDKTGKQPQVEVAMRIFDENGKPTLARPLTGKVEGDVPEKLQAIPMQFGMTANHAGRFSVELTAVDRVSGKTARVNFPFRVVAVD